MRRLRVLIMSVGDASENGTVKYLRRLKAPKDSVIVVLPKSSETFAESYRKIGLEPFIYDQDKYIDDAFEFYGHKPRNCGGVGRQGIAEATEAYDDDETVLLELDDDTSNFTIRDISTRKSITITKWSNFEKLFFALDDFRRETGVELMCATGASPTNKNFIANTKIFNNFIMRKGNRNNFRGFAALCSDDYRYNIFQNLFNCTPMWSSPIANIHFTKPQGARQDGNATLYNTDCSWKKSFAVRMMAPSWCSQTIKREKNGWLFRESLKQSSYFPPICGVDKNGKIVGVLNKKFNNADESC